MFVCICMFEFNLIWSVASMEINQLLWSQCNSMDFIDKEPDDNNNGYRYVQGLFQGL